jgi:hypothetical protein
LLISEEDFELLHDVSMAWGEQWKHQQRRFSSKHPIHFNHLFAYWFGNYGSYLLGRQFLINIGTDYQELVDEASGDFVLLTNYVSITWRKH